MGGCAAPPSDKKAEAAGEAIVLQSPVVIAGRRRPEYPPLLGLVSARGRKIFEENVFHLFGEDTQSPSC